LNHTEWNRENSGAATRLSAVESLDPIKAADQKLVSGVQRFTDSVIDRTLLWLFPRWVRPNHLTAVRFILIPVVLLLLHYDLRWWAFAVFVVAVSTDFIDGAMARTRDQITYAGIIMDPLADKLLIGAVLLWIGHDHLVVQIVLAFIAAELLLSAAGLAISRSGWRARPANVFGKAKMIMQSIALMLLFVAGILDIPNVLEVSFCLLWVAIALAFLSSSMHILATFRERRRKEGREQKA
jgi:CDP-diacylglycerol--glycerol-3-phosphate 3-phosphatidyltransferase